MAENARNSIGVSPFPQYYKGLLRKDRNETLDSWIRIVIGNSFTPLTEMTSATNDMLFPRDSLCGEK